MIASRTPFNTVAGNFNASPMWTRKRKPNSPPRGSEPTRHRCSATWVVLAECSCEGRSRGDEVDGPPRSGPDQGYSLPGPRRTNLVGSARGRILGRPRRRSSRFDRSGYLAPLRRPSVRCAHADIARDGVIERPRRNAGRSACDRRDLQLGDPRTHRDGRHLRRHGRKPSSLVRRALSRQASALDRNARR